MRIRSKVAQASLAAGMFTGFGASALLYTQTASADTTKTYTTCASEWGTCSFTGSRVVRYGDQGHFVFKTLSNGTVCRNDVFGGDPHVGVTKSCALESVTTTTPTPVPMPPPATGGPKTYTECAKEWATCSFSGTKVIRYGNEGHFVFKTFSNGTPCRNDAFGGDPQVGMAKRCSIQSGTVVTDPGPTVPPPVVTPPVVTPPPVVTAPPTTTPGSAKRPGYNKGTGFFVSGNKLYDANGNEFRMRGVNKVHWDNTSPGLNNANANATRWTIDFNRRPADNVALLQGATGSAGTIAKQHVVIPGNWDGTCKDEASYLTRMVDTWVGQFSTWNQLEKHMILNIANEWGPGGDGTVWRDQNIAAIKRLRAAGYHMTISVTAGGCGQDPNSILKWGPAVFDSDPEKNVIFDQHIYGVYADTAGGAPKQYSNQPELDAHVKALAATGLVVALGEFGPGRNIGPSPTLIKPERVIQLSEASGLGWLAWAWDDNNLAGGQSDESSFSMSYSGGYSKSGDLTTFGRMVVEDSKFGLKVLAKPASIFK